MRYLRWNPELGTPHKGWRRVGGVRTAGTRVPERRRAYQTLPVGAAAGCSSWGPTDRPHGEDPLEIIPGGQEEGGGGCSQAGSHTTLQRQVRVAPAGSGGGGAQEVQPNDGGNGARHSRTAGDSTTAAPTAAPAAAGGSEAQKPQPGDGGNGARHPGTPRNSGTAAPASEA
ncbi:unnamed protein product [Ectocarpus sp. 12 AP-2014]